MGKLITASSNTKISYHPVISLNTVWNTNLVSDEMKDYAYNAWETHDFDSYYYLLGIVSCRVDQPQNLYQYMGGRFQDIMQQGWDDEQARKT